VKKIVLIIVLFLGLTNAKAQEKSSTNFTEYRLESFQTPLVAKKMMFDWYGKWDKVLYTPDNRALLVWANKRIINESPETFNLIASSFQNEDEMFGTIQILTSKNEDALAENSPYREYLNEFIKTISKQENSNKRFFREYIKVEY
jgi:hypothetical protein